MSIKSFQARIWYNAPRLYEFWLLATFVILIILVVYSVIPAYGQEDEIAINKVEMVLLVDSQYNLTTTLEFDKYGL